MLHSVNPIASALLSLARGGHGQAAVGLRIAAGRFVNTGATGTLASDQQAGL
jgi:hypothetical protein